MTIREPKRRDATDHGPHSSDVVPSIPIRQKAEVSDANESVWQHMLQEASQELDGAERAQLCAIPIRIVTPAERYFPVLEGYDPVIADGDPVGVLRQIRQNLLRPAEWSLRVADPFLSSRSFDGDVGQHVSR